MTSERVIIVDDEADVAGYLAAALEDDGFEALAFTGASEALTELRRERPDALCLDLLMPGHTGLWLYRKIRESSTFDGMPVLVVTGLAIQGGLRSLLPAGEPPDLPEPDAWIEKPVDLRRFRASVQSLVRTQEEENAS